MDFLKFKKKFIQLYNEQKFEHFDGRVVNFIFSAKTEEISDVSFYPAVTFIPVEEVIKFGLTVGELNIFLGQLLQMSEFKEIFDISSPLLYVSKSIDLNSKPESSLITLQLDAELNICPVITISGIKDVVSSVKLDTSTFINSPLQSLPETHLRTAFTGLADLTFFTKFIYLEGAISFKFDSQTIMHASRYNNLHELNLTAKFNDTTAMKSITEYYISFYDDGTLLSQVSNKLLYDFVYNEI